MGQNLLPQEIPQTETKGSNQALPILPFQEILGIQKEALTRLLLEDSGDGALLYLHLLRYHALPTWAETRLLKAQEALNRLGLLPSLVATSAEAESIPYAPPSVPAPLIQKVESAFAPEYTTADIVLALDSDTTFRQLFDAVQQQLGKPLSNPDIKYLLEIYDHLELSVDVIQMLVTFCIKRQKLSHNSQKPPSMKSIKSEGARWHNQGILTMANAMEYTDSLKVLSAQQQEVVKIFHLKQTIFNSKMQKDLKQWNDWGFSMDVYPLAYDRCRDGLAAQGSDETFNWNYCGGIFQNWHKKNLHSKEEILAQEQGTYSKARQGTGGKKYSKGPYAHDTMQMTATSQSTPEQAQKLQQNFDYMDKILDQFPIT
ncbi:MAG: DnaD domain protein [Eubacteriales bacterium]